VRDLVGHGLGKDLHEEPQVPNYGKKGTGLVLQEGLVIAIEPMINMGTHKVKTLKDGWSIVTGDLKYSAHFEHTIVVRKNKAEVLSSFELVEKALAVN
jgi:methionyl aminopeptidase